jgi:hypothetical protein
VATRTVDNPTMTDGARDVYRVERVAEGPGHVGVSLVRVTEQEVMHLLRRHVEVLDRTVLFHRTFRPMVELVEMERYAERLSAIARWAAERTFGCFVLSEPEAGNVVVSLYERWFDGTEVHTDQLARRVFDSSDEQALVASAEFLAELQSWAEQRNDEREAAYRTASGDEEARRLQVAEREAAGRELAQILAEHTGPND